MSLPWYHKRSHLNWNAAFSSPNLDVTPAPIENMGIPSHADSRTRSCHA